MTYENELQNENKKSRVVCVRCSMSARTVEAIKLSRLTLFAYDSSRCSRFSPRPVHPRFSLRCSPSCSPYLPSRQQASSHAFVVSVGVVVRRQRRQNDPALTAPADLLQCTAGMLLMVKMENGEMLCTGSEGCVPYEAPTSTSASKQSLQSPASRLWYNGRAPIII